jgi:hypothetical protein
MTKDVSRRPLNAEARVRARLSPRGICGRQRGRLFYEHFGCHVSKSFHRDSPYSYIMRGMVAAVQRHCLNSTIYSSVCVGLKVDLIGMYIRRREIYPKKFLANRSNRFLLKPLRGVGEKTREMKRRTYNRPLQTAARALHFCRAQERD